MTTRFIARQPILNRRREVFAYELLFRSGLENYFHADAASMGSSIVDSALLFGLDSLTGNSRAFINVSQDVLLKGLVMLLPPSKVVCEILETVIPNQETLQACAQLKEANYLLALDDFQYAPEWEPFFELADFVKIDFLATPMAECKRLAASFSGRKIGLIAEKIEDRKQFEAAKCMGFSYFQGYFLYKPEVISQGTVPGLRLQYIRILALAAQADLNFREIEQTIRQDPSLCYKLLRYLNSAALGFRKEIRSIRFGLTLLGEDALRRWIAVSAVVSLAEEHPGELVRTALVRAFFCESVAKMAGVPDRGVDFFFLGLLSVMDVILRQPMSVIVRELPIASDIRQALMREQNEPQQVLKILLGYESGRWSELSQIAAELKLTEEQLPEYYNAAIRWADHVLAG